MKIDIVQLKFIHPTLRQLLAKLEKDTSLEFTVTSSYRIGDPGVHGTLPVRGIDLRVRYKEVGKEIETLINTIWQYDESRPKLMCALLHGEGANLHLHTQVSDVTTQQEDK